MVEQFIQVPSIVDVALMDEPALQEHIVQRLREKLAITNDLRDLRARNGEVVFHPAWAQRELNIELRWEVADEPCLDRSGCAFWAAPTGQPHNHKTWAAVFGKGYLQLDRTPAQTWIEAARDLAKKLGVADL